MLLFLPALFVEVIYQSLGSVLTVAMQQYTVSQKNVPLGIVHIGMTENAGRETNGRNWRHEIAVHENAGTKWDVSLNKVYI